MILVTWRVESNLLFWLLAWKLSMVCSVNAGAGQCMPCNHLHILAVWRTEVPHGWRLLQLLFQIQGCLVTNHQWQTLGADIHPSWGTRERFCVETSVSTKNLLELCGKKKSEILPTKFILLSILIKNTSHKVLENFISERRAVTFRTFIASAAAFLHAVCHLVPAMSTREVMRPTPTQV